MPEPEVQQLHNVGPTVARWRVPDVIFFLYLSIVFCLGFPILPYALSFYWHFVLRPLHFILFLKGFHPPLATDEGVKGMLKGVLESALADRSAMAA